MSTIENIIAANPIFSEVFKQHEKLTAKLFFDPDDDDGGALSAGNVVAYSHRPPVELRVRSVSENGFRRVNDEEIDITGASWEFELDDRGELGEWLINMVDALPPGDEFIADERVSYRGAARIEETRSQSKEPWRVTTGRAMIQITSTPQQTGEFSTFTARVTFEDKPVVTKRSATPPQAEPYVAPLSLVSVAPESYGSVYRQVHPDYTGPLIEVRRASDSATLDIGFVADNGLLDTDALSTFCGASDGFVRTLYDQSGNGYDLLNTADPAQQPKIYDGSTGLITDPTNGQPAMLWDHGESGFAAPYLEVSSQVNTNKPDLTRMVTFQPAAGKTHNDNHVVGHPSASSRNRLVQETPGTGGEVGIGGALLNVTETFDMRDSDTLYTMFVQYDDSTGIVQLYSGAANVSDNSPTTDIGNNDHVQATLGAPPNHAASAAFLGFIQEYATFYGLLTAADRAALVP